MIFRVRAWTRRLTLVMHPFSLLRNWRYCFLFVFLVTVGFIYYNCSTEHKYQRYPMGRNPLSIASTQQQLPPIDVGPRRDFQATALDRELDFDINGNDVIVFLHMQKTGGTTFGKHLTRNLFLLHSQEPPCTCIKKHKRCQCYRPSSKHQIWLFSRLSVGWMCGLHADWTELKACVPEAMDRREKIKVKRRYFYITMVRNPLSRYISEWRHTQRGATWKWTQHMCNGRPATEAEIPPCYEGSTWMGVSLEDFSACPSNIAANRQTRMIADMTLVNCYNYTGMSRAEVDRTMLESAKANLESMAYFGMTEYQSESQYLFERTFRMRFGEPLLQANLTIANSSPITRDQMDLVQSRNLMDVELYAFAKDLFFQRYKYMKQLEALKEEHEDVIMGS